MRQRTVADTAAQSPALRGDLVMSVP